MTPKEFLKQGWRMQQLLQTHREELARLRTLLESPSGGKLSPEGKVQGGGTGSKEQDLAAKVVDMEREINAEAGRMVEVLRDVHAAIEAVSDPDERLVLRCRYVLFESFDTIAKETNYSKRQVLRIHGQALQDVKVPEKYQSHT